MKARAARRLATPRFASLLALAIATLVAAPEVRAQPHRERTVAAPAVSQGREGTGGLRAHFGLDLAARLLRSSDPDVRLRGVERAAAMHTPEALALLVREIEGGAIHQDPRALLVIVRGLSTWIERDAARSALEKVLEAPAPSLTPHLGSPVNQGASTGRDPAADDADSVARVALAREEAAVALAESGETAALEWLVAAVRKPGPAPESAPALDALAIHPPAAPLLGGVVLTTPAIVWLAAAVGDLRSLGAILGVVHASDPALRAAALMALGGAGDGRVLEAARESIKDKDPRVRVAAADALARLRAPDGGQALEVLIADDATARDALRIARNVQGEGVTKAAAARAAASADPDLRRLAIAVLGRQTSPEAVTALVSFAMDRTLEADAMDALARSPSSSALPALEALGASPHTRRIAARAYFVRRSVRAQRSTRLDALLAELAAAADGADRAVGVEALVALGEASLERALGDSDVRVRRAAAIAARAAGHEPSRARFLLARLATETDETTQRVLAVGLMSGDPAGSVPTLALVDRAQSGGSDAPLATFALARRADEQLAAKVDSLLASRDPLVRAHAARGLGQSSAPDAVGKLARAYAFEPKQTVRRAIVDGLAHRIADDGAIPPMARATLELAARLDPDRVTRDRARRALLGEAAPRTGPANEVAWLRLLPAEGAALPRDMTAALVTPSGLALPVSFDEDGYLLVPGLPPGEVYVRLAPRLPAYEARTP
jgi:HEAT repeat protein